MSFSSRFSHRFINSSLTKPHIRNQCRFVSSRAEFLENSVWTVFTPLAVKNKAVNLGQGAPEFPFASEILKNYQSIVDASQHQYCRSHGDPALVERIAALFEKDSSLSYNPMTDVIVTAGATNALYTILQCHINPGDEVIMFSPHYDAYPVQVKQAQGKPVYVPFEEPSDPEEAADSNKWTIDVNRLEKSITSKTKMLIINNPHNPLGKIFSRSELKAIAEVAKKHDLIVVSDEVYEFLVFPSSPLKHTRIASLPGMKERTLTISSSGKTYSNTGWKIGWIVGPENLVDVCGRSIQYQIFCQASPLQRAVTKCLEEDPEMNIPKATAKHLEERYLQLKPLLEAQGMKTTRPYAGYFTLARIDHIKFPRDSNSGRTRDYDFCLWMPGGVGVCAIPPSAFYSKEHGHLAEHYARFSFAKKAETITAAEPGLKRLSEYIA